MAAANPSTSGGIRQPYHIILAGAHDVGKTTIFNTLVEEFRDSYKFKAGNKNSPNVQFMTFRHKYMDDSSEIEVRQHCWLSSTYYRISNIIQLWLHDTAGMEKKGGVVSMTRSYFRQAIGVILVYDTSNLESLHTVMDWVGAAEETCEFAQHLVYALWGNEKGSLYSSVNNPVEQYHLKDFLAKLENTLARPIEIEDQLVCRMNGIDQSAVANNYETLVRTLHSKVKEIDTVMKEASQRINLADHENLGGEGDTANDQPRSRCMQIKC